MRSPRLLRTCSALVGESRFDRLALGAASGNSHARITAWINGWLGQRTPTVGPPAVTMGGILSEHGNTMVSGPGQNAAANFPAGPGHSATHRRASSNPATWTMIGFSGGLPLTSNMRPTAAASQALAASP